MWFLQIALEKNLHLQLDVRNRQGKNNRLYNKDHPHCRPPWARIQIPRMHLEHPSMDAVHTLGHRRKSHIKDVFFFLFLVANKQKCSMHWAGRCQVWKHPIHRHIESRCQEEGEFWDLEREGFGRKYIAQNSLCGQPGIWWEYQIGRGQRSHLFLYCLAWTLFSFGNSNIILSSGSVCTPWHQCKVHEGRVLI